jgi:hypothetical protein
MHLSNGSEKDHVIIGMVRVLEMQLALSAAN